MKLFFIGLTTLALLSACDNSSSKSNTVAPTTPPTQQGQPPTPTPTPVPAPVVTLPVVSFGYNEYVYDGSHKIYLELKLDKASDVPVVVDVELIPGTALFNRDYTGFVGSADRTKQSVVFAPQQILVDLPAIWIPNDAACSSELTAQMVSGSVQKATIATASSTRIVLNCQ